MTFHNKNILITGASSGIGKELARQLSFHKCNLIILARRIDKLQETASELAKNGSIIQPFQCDVGSKEEVERAYKDIKGQFGIIDIAVLNAGIGTQTDPESYDSKPAEETFGANFFGIVY